MIKLTYDVVRDSFESKGYTLLSKEYVNSKTKLDYKCPNNHEHSMVWSNWLQGKRCQICSGNLILNIEHIKNDFKKEGYILLSKEYINSKQKLQYTCPEGHQHSVTWGNWQQGYRCFYCSHNLPPDINSIKIDMNTDGYKLLSDKYISAKSKMTIECSKKHVFKSCWNNWQQGKRCPICPSQQSKFEKEIKLFIDNLGITYSTNDRTMLINPETNRSLELDLYFPKLNKAIECNGVYWHSRVSVYNRDTIKKKLCLDRNIDLLIITDEEWITEKSNMENKIKLFISGEHNG